jgi:nucleobase:cation symporter-1, NCS1 family
MSRSYLHDPGLTNPDLAPAPASKRTWEVKDIASLWVGMAVCIPTYSIASSLLAGGLTWWQAVLTVLLGNLIVLVPMTLNAHPGTAYGIPFPVLLRSSFGTRGANIAAMLRGIVACGWFGIQTWIGGDAIFTTLGMIFGFDKSVPIEWLGISVGQFACFMAFWFVNVYFILAGMESIKWLEVLSAPFLLIVGVALMFWAVTKVGGFGPILSQNSKALPMDRFLPAFGASLTAMVGFWATLSLNIPDFSRYARTQKDQIYGQALGLPPTMTLYSFIGIVVTGATVILYGGQGIWDPVQVIGRIGNKWISCLALVALALATLSTNIAANVVSPANDFSNLAPKHISFRRGGMITAFIGVLMFPWKLYADPNQYIFTWLIGYSALLGPIAGIMIADYFVFRRRHLEVDDLYREQGIYRFTNGFGLAALAAFGLSVLPNLPGFLAQIKVIDPASLPAIFKTLYQQAWFGGFALGFILYLVFRKLAPAKITAAQ